MERVAKFLKEAETYYLATVEGDQPRVRPFGTAHIFEGKLYIQTGKVKDVSKQEEINAGLEKAIDSLEYEYQKEDIKKYIQTKEPIKILLLDQTNSGVTQLR